MISPGRDSPVVKLTLLGGFDLRVAEQSAVALPRKAQALLAYLVVQDVQTAAREAVADLLWTDRGAEQARHSLRQTLLTIRHGLGIAGDGAVHSHGGMLSIVSGLIELDTDRLAHLLPSTSWADLIEVTKLYIGPLLDGFPPVSANFDEWLMRKREQLADGVLRAMERLANSWAISGEVHEAVLVTERMFALDPLREDVHRRVMEAYVRAGRRSDAVRHYDECVMLLRRELDVAPAIETKMMFERIRRGENVVATAPATNNVPTAARTFSQPTGVPPRPGDPNALAPRLTIVAPPVGPVIAILPFRVGSRSEDGHWIAQGLVDDLISSLGWSGAVAVIARNSSVIFGAETATTQEIARQLGAQYLVEGSLGITGGRVRVSVRIVEESSARQLWAGRLERTVSDIFAVQDEIAMEVSGVLQSELSRREQERVASLPPTSDVDAYMLLQRGMWHHYRPTRRDAAAAQRLFREALAIDPDYARARAALAISIISAADDGWWTAGREQGLLEGMGIARGAIGSDPTCAEAWHALGQGQRLTDHMLDESTASFAEAIALNPSSAGSRAALAWNLTARGHLREAIASLEAALRLGPRDPRIHLWLPALAEAAYLERRYQDALHITWRANAIRGTWFSYAYQAASLAQLGRMAEARSALAEARRREPTALRTMELSLKSFTDPSMAEHILEGLRLAGSTDLKFTEPESDPQSAGPEIKSEPPLGFSSRPRAD